MRPFHCILLFALCVSQFLPLAFCAMALPTILLVQGVPLEKISLIYLVGMIWVLKFIWAPLVDRVKFGRFGHYKPWLIISQTLLVATTIVFTLVGDVNNFQLMLIMAVLICVFASTQDIAADAIACRLIPENQRGLGSAIQMSGGLIATVLGGGVVLVLYEYIGWQLSMWVIAAAVAAAISLIVLFDETDIELSQEVYLHRPTLGRLISFWLKPGMGIWAAILIILPLSITVAWALASPILVQRGWTTDKIGILLHIIAPILGVIVAVGFGYLLNNYNKWLVISLVPILQLVAVLVLYSFIDVPLSVNGIILALLLVYCMDIALFVVLNAFKLEFSDDGTEGTDFTVQNSLHALAAFAVAAAALFFAESTGFANLILISIGLTLFSGLFLYCIVALQKRNGVIQNPNLTS
ncbi:MAG: MFS transporter [Pseudomonadota bacterium]